MTELSDLYALSDMLEAATGPSRELDVAVACISHYVPGPCRPGSELGTYIGPDMFTRKAPNFTSSIDAAEALRQRLLPGSFIWLQKDTVWECRIVTLDDPASEDVCRISEAPTEPLARLKATVAALIATKEQPR